MMKKSMAGAGAVLLLSMLLSACGGGDGGTSIDLTGKDNSAEPVAVQDGFVTAIAAVIAVTSDTADPVTIDAIPVTAPSNTAPVPLS